MVIGLSVTGGDWGGKQAWMLQIASDLARAGHEVDLLAEPGALCSRAPAAGVVCRPVDFAAPDSVPADRLRRWHLALTTGRRDAVVIADALHSMRLATPHATMRHSPFPLDRTDPATLRMLRGLSALIVTSEAQRAGEAAELVEASILDAGRVHLVRSGIQVRASTEPQRVSLRPRDLGIAPGAAVIGIVARLSWEKGHRVLLQAFEQLTASRPDVHLVIVGDGPERSALERLATDLGISDRVTFAGFREDVTGILPLLDAFVLPSVAGETGPLALKEAMAMARPVVASRVGGIPEVVRDGETGLLVEPGAAAALRDALSRVLTDPQLARSLGRAAREAMLLDGDWTCRSGAFVALVERIAVEAGPPAAILAQLRWNDTARVRAEEFGGLVFVPSTSSVVELSRTDFDAVARLPGAADATPLMAAAASSPHLVTHLYEAGALRMGSGQAASG